MNELLVINLNDPIQFLTLKTFLSEQGFMLDEIDYAVVIKVNQMIVASCCKLKNVLKFFAVNPYYQKQGLTSSLLTAISYRLFEEGHNHSYVFTLPSNLEIFTSLGFSEVLSTKEVSFLEKGVTTIKNFIKSLDETCHCSSKKNKSIVMNANPFTLGHLYLIEEAAKQSEQLLIFVVEEDASSVPFYDRIAMISLGTAHLKNVKVLPSTSYIISRATFPNYFLRDREHSFLTYATLDLSIFGHYFTKLNIIERFVGDEPLDLMTSDYNNLMKQILPKYGVKVTVIKRKENKYGVISASKVRQLIKEDNYDALVDYVPNSTLEYIKNNPELVNRIKQYGRAH